MTEDVERLRFTNIFVNDLYGIKNINLKMRVCSKIWTRTKEKSLGKENYIVVEVDGVLFNAVLIFAKNGSIIFTRLLDHKDSNLKKIQDAIMSAQGLEGKNKEKGLQTYHNLIENIGLTPEHKQIILNEIKENE